MLIDEDDFKIVSSLVQELKGQIEYHNSMVHHLIDSPEKVMYTLGKLSVMREILDYIRELEEEAKNKDNPTDTAE